MDLAHHIRSVVGIDPAATAIHYQGQWYPWGFVHTVGEQLDRRISKAIGSGEEAVALVTQNRPAVLAALLGLFAANRCVAAIRPTQPDEALAAELAELRPAVVIADADDWEREGLRLGAEAAGALGLVVSHRGGEPVAVAPGLDEVRGADHFRASEGDALSIQTSGTSGPPKRIVLGYGELTDSLARIQELYTGRRESEPRLRDGVALQAAPLGHISALLAVGLAVVQGRRIALLDRFEPQAWADAVYEHKIATAGVPPAALRMLLDAGIPPERLASLRVVRAGTAPLDPALALEFERTYGIPVIQAYGSTEFQGVASWTLEDYRQWGEAKRGSVGRPQPGVALRILDPETGEPVAPGEQGVLEVGLEAQGSDWVRTNDLARLDQDGFLWIDGRLDDVIIRGGFKVDPVEVAHVLREHPAVREAAVVGLPDQRLGEVPAAAVVVDPDQPVTGEELRTWLRQRVEPYKVPLEVRLVPSLPRNVTMKTTREGLRRLFEQAPAP